MTFEADYEDVLQNIELGIVQVYRQHPDMVDWDALTGLDALIQFYNAEARGKPAELRNLSGLSSEVAQSVKAMCEWRLSRNPLLDEHDRTIEIEMPSMTPKEIVACLKRIRKSIDLHTRRGGLQGYLNFIVEYVR